MLSAAVSDEIGLSLTRQGLSIWRIRNFFGYFNGSPEVFRLAVLMYIRYSLLLRQVGDLQFECGVDICEETVRFGGTGSATCLSRNLEAVELIIGHNRTLGEVFVRINGETHHLWRAVVQEGEALEVYATKRWDRKAAFKYLKRAMKRHGRPKVIVTDRLRSYRATM